MKEKRGPPRSASHRALSNGPDRPTMRSIRMPKHRPGRGCQGNVGLPGKGGRDGEKSRAKRAKTSQMTALLIQCGCPGSVNRCPEGRGMVKRMRCEMWGGNREGRGPCIVASASRTRVTAGWCGTSPLRHAGESRLPSKQGGRGIPQVAHIWDNRALRWRTTTPGHIRSARHRPSTPRKERRVVSQHYREGKTERGDVLQGRTMKGSIAFSQRAKSPHLLKHPVGKERRKVMRGGGKPTRWNVLHKEW